MLGLGNGRRAPLPRSGRAGDSRLLVAVAAAWCLATPNAGAQTPDPSHEADGLLHASLTLENQEIHVAFSPGLRADGPAYQNLLSGAVGSRVRVGTLVAHRALRLGTLAPDIDAIEAEIAAVVAERQAEAAARAAESPGGEDETGEAGEDTEEAAGETQAPDGGEQAAAEMEESAEPADPVLWLARDTAGWQLEIHPADEGAMQVVPLGHVLTDSETAAFTASIHATGAETGRLALGWGRHAWSADFRFEELPETPRAARVSGRGTARLAADSNDAIARANMLSERNETALVLPNGASITMLFWKSIDVEDEDYPSVAAVGDGSVIEMIRAPVLRLKTDVALRFGKTDISTGNLAPGFAGAYGVWLRKAEGGWRFVFNHEPDSWGTQYDPDFDAAEIAVDYARTAGSFRPLGATLVPRGADRGRLIVHWGPHEWAADFVVPSLAAAAAGSATASAASATATANASATAPAPASGGAAEEWTAPRTAWGDPDLQGIWNNSTTTPLERLTEAEQDRGQAARAPVIAATRGTGAAWPETGGRLDQPSLIVDPPDGRIVLTPAAIERLVARESAREGRGEADTWLDRNSWERCISRTLPVMMIPNLYNNNYQILQTPDHVAIQVEMIHETRIIPLDGGPHVADGIRQWLGNSRGRWEGDTLVVETIGFHDRLDGGDYQPSHILQTGHRGSGATLRLVERFTRVDAETIDYRFTVEDPATYERPYTAAIPMRWRENQEPIYEYACHEGNYGMVNLLSGGRADEQLALDAAALVSRQRIEAGHPGVREPAVPFVEPDGGAGSR
ncbi:MAG: DUF2911 domain-containing protein [Acidobacteria bacterium]|nr:DUF2911 domain-containing protein [Acidobacteriota bacterium]